MKLKYYLRGLAVGIILTTIIITIANADNRPMTDAEVRQRALELGMVESSSLKLTDVGESTQPSSEPESSPESKEPTVEPESSPESTPESTPESSSSSEAESVADELVGGEPVIITIKSGDSSYTVSKALAAAGLVEDAVEYDNYLCNNGYSRKIRTGSYEIMPGMSYEEIAKIIAR